MAATATAPPDSPDVLDQREILAALRAVRKGDFSVRLPLEQTGVAGDWNVTFETPQGPQVVTVTLKLEAGKLQHLSLILNRRQRARLRSGHYLVGVLLTDGADHYGPSRFSRLTVLR